MGHDSPDESTLDLSADPAPLRRERTVSRETALYGLLALCGLAIRLAMLGRWPLLPDEVTTALAASRVLNGAGAAGLDYLPLLLDAQVALLSPDLSPLSVRLLSAFAGALLVLLPYRERSWLGRTGALFVSALWAFMPSWVYASRTADGAIVSLALGLLGLSLLRQGIAAGRLSPARAGAACLGLALASGPQVLSLLLSVAGVTLLGWQQSDAGARSLWRHRWSAADPRALLVALVAAWAAASGALLLNPGGLGAAVDMAGSWFGALRPETTLPAYQMPLVLAVYEPFALLLGLGGLFIGLRRHARIDVSLGLALLATLLLTTALGQRDARWVLSVALPLSILSGRAVQYAAESAAIRWERLDILALVAVTLLSGLALVEGTGYLQTGDKTYLWLTLLAIGLIVTFLIGYATLAGRVPAMRVAGTLALAAALMLSMRGSVALAYDRARDPWEPMLYGPTSETLVEMERLIEHLSLVETGDPRAADIAYEQSLDPYVGWLLRGYPNARAVVGVGAPSQATILISGPRGQATEPSGYAGQSFALRQWRPPQARSARQVMQWLLFRQPGPAPLRDELWLWVKVQPAGEDGD